MSDIATKLTTIAENQQRVYDAGYSAGQADGGDTETAYNNGVTDGKQAEYDRFWDNYQQNGNREDYKCAFAGSAWTTEILRPKYPIAIVDEKTTSRNAYKMFKRLGYNVAEGNDFDMTELCKRVDLSGARNLQGLLYNACVKNVTIDASSSTTLQEAFRGGDGGRINYLTLTVSDACTNYTNAFYYCNRLTDLTFTQGSVIAAAVDLKNSPLNKASIESVMAALSDTTTGLTATFKATAVNTAFETSGGAADGSTSEEWLALVASKENWTITLA